MNQFFETMITDDVSVEDFGLSPIDYFNNVNARMELVAIEQDFDVYMYALNTYNVESSDMTQLSELMGTSIEHLTISMESISSKLEKIKKTIVEFIKRIVKWVNDKYKQIVKMFTKTKKSTKKDYEASLKYVKENGLEDVIYSGDKLNEELLEKHGLGALKPTKK